MGCLLVLQSVRITVLVGEVCMNTIEKHRRSVAWWLFGVSAMVFGMIALGGLTRLTESGLSMVDWKPLMGVIPPIGEAAWIEKFNQYKAYPEYQKINVGMTLSDFQYIFYFEYGHRVLGRLIGMAFGLPALYFGIRGAFSGAFRNRIVVLFFLGGLQGLVGWWMVKSGLVDRPDVSHYRLTTHLGLAVFLYIALLWTAFRHARGGEGVSYDWSNGARWSLAWLGMVYATLLSGGLVAGLNAGAQYNTFPLMGGKWIPDGLFIRDPLLSNLTENLVTVQFNHRYLAMTTATLIVAFALKRLKQVTTVRQRYALIAMIAAVVFQVSLGISTLLTAAWVPLASMHQMGAILLLSSLVWATHELSVVSESKKKEHKSLAS